VVVPDFFYGDPVIDFNEPKFDIKPWLKTHNTVSFLLFSCNIWDGHMKNCARIMKRSRGHSDLPLMSKLTYYHTFIAILFGS
jgi:hypothetical protein